MDAAREVLVVSDIWMNAPPEAIVDLVAVPPLAQSESESEHLLKLVGELLNGAPLADITADETNFLALEAAVEPAAVADLRQSATLARDTGVPLEAWYGLGRQGLSLASLQSVFKHSMQDLRGTIEASVESRVVPRFAPGALDTVMGNLAEVAARTTVVHANTTCSCDFLKYAADGHSPG